MVSGQCALLYVSGVPQCSQNWRVTGGEEAYERADPAVILNESRGTVAQATAWAPLARRQDSQWHRLGAITGDPHS
jgi:hypothetical protein